MWRRDYEEHISCNRCGKCQSPISVHAPVWRMRINHRPSMFGGWSYDTMPCCEECASNRTLTVFENPAPCENCGRTVHNELRMIDRKHVYCCEKCGAQAQAKAAREKRTASRVELSCRECGVTFQPARMDTKFCCSACKQKAYRKRVTDTKCVSRDTLKSRNADGQSRYG